VEGCVEVSTESARADRKRSLPRVATQMKLRRKAGQKAAASDEQNSLGGEHGQKKGGRYRFEGEKKKERWRLRGLGGGSFRRDGDMKL